MDYVLYALAHGQQNPPGASCVLLPVNAREEKDTMQTQTAERAAPPIATLARPKSLFETRLTDAYRQQWDADEAAVRDVAALAVGFLRHAEAALSPIIGRQSVGALYQRSLYLTRSEHPWLAVAYGEWMPADPFVVLQKAVSRQPLSNAQAAVLALLSKFRSLLDNLIGPSLTAQLLRA